MYAIRDQVLSPSFRYDPEKVQLSLIRYEITKISEDAKTAQPTRREQKREWETESSVDDWEMPDDEDEDFNLYVWLVAPVNPSDRSRTSRSPNPRSLARTARRIDPPAVRPASRGARSPSRRCSPSPSTSWTASRSTSLRAALSPATRTCCTRSTRRSR